MERAASQIENDLGPIDVWINNAMVTVVSPTLDLTEAELRRVNDVSYLGSAWGTLAALRRMVPRNRGHVIQVGSALAYRSIPLQAAYCAAKHATRGFLDSIRSELIRDGSQVQITMVQLPAINTPQFSWCRTRFDHHPQPVPPIHQPEVAARAIVGSIGLRRREVFVGYPTVKAILGSKLAPGYADHRLAQMGWDGQMSALRIPPDRPDNLFDPLPGDRGAHGIFDDRAKSRSPWAELSIAWSRIRSAALRAFRKPPLALPRPQRTRALRG